MRRAALGVRVLRTRLSAHLKRVREGAAILVTAHGRANGRLTPAGAMLEERLRGLVAAGIVGSFGQQVRVSRPWARTKRGGSLAGLIAGARV